MSSRLPECSDIETSMIAAQTTSRFEAACVVFIEDVKIAFGEARSSSSIKRHGF